MEEIITPLPTGVIQVLQKVEGEDNLAYCIEVGADVSGESQAIQDLAASLWTQEVIDARAAFKASLPI